MIIKSKRECFLIRGYNWTIIMSLLILNQNSKNSNRISLGRMTICFWCRETTTIATIEIRIKKGLTGQYWGTIIAIAKVTIKVTILTITTIFITTRTITIIKTNSAIQQQLIIYTNKTAIWSNKYYN